MNKYTFTFFQTYPVSIQATNKPVSIQATNKGEAYRLIYVKMKGVDNWEVVSVESECMNCGSVPEEVVTETDNYTICPKGCFIAI